MFITGPEKRIYPYPRLDTRVTAPRVVPPVPALTRQQRVRRVLAFSNTEMGVDSPNNYCDFLPQSQEEHAEPTNNATGAGTTIIEYIDEDPGSLMDYSAVLNSSFYNDYIASSDLSKFLSRPVLISSVVWQEGVGIGVSPIYPWYLYFNDTAIKRKLENYAFLSCDLHVKIMLNASPFYYGLAMAFYTPMTQYYPTPLKTIGSGDPEFITASQRPHIYLYPQCNKGGEMMLPFFYNKNWLNTASAQDFRDMGYIDIYDIVMLQNANSVAAGDVDIQIYAWAENVRVCGPTTQAVLQSGETDCQPQAKDEYGKGPVSKPASAVAAATGALSKVPVIGPYMRASSMVAGTIGDIASWFGYTNVPIISDVQPYKPVAFQAMATSEISVPIEKLTLDPKNELSIDPSITGIPSQDELVVSTICKKESYFDQTTWSTSETPETLLWWAYVNPYVARRDTVVGPPAYDLRTFVPMSHLCSLFTNWRGSIIYRFRVICTKFHRGRLKIQWDPTANVASSTAENSTVVFTKIVDITKTQDFEIAIPYIQTQSWLKLAGPQYDTWGTGSVARPAYVGAGGSGAPNGCLSVKVLTVQTSPVASAPITLAVSIRAGDDFELANPMNSVSNSYTYFTPQAQEIDYEDTELITVTTPTLDPNRFLINYGESMVSIRQLMRRFNFYKTIKAIPGTTSSVIRFNCLHGRLPVSLGYDPNGLEKTVGNVAYNYVKHTAISWMAMCYIGYRGSVNYTYNARTNVSFTSSTDIEHMSVSRLPANSRTVAGYLTNVVWVAADNPSEAARQALNDNYTLGGMALTNQKTQSGLQVAYPMYNLYRFMSCNPDYASLGTGYDDSDRDSFLLDMFYFSSSTLSASSVYVDIYCAAGTDFNFIFYLNAPQLYVASVPNALA